MVGTDELAVKMPACYAVYSVTIHLAVSVDDAMLAREIFVFGMKKGATVKSWERYGESP